MGKQTLGEDGDAAVPVPENVFRRMPLAQALISACALMLIAVFWNAASKPDMLIWGACVLLIAGSWPTLALPLWKGARSMRGMADLPRILLTAHAVLMAVALALFPFAKVGDRLACFMDMVLIGLICSGGLFLAAVPCSAYAWLAILGCGGMLRSAASADSLSAATLYPYIFFLIAVGALVALVAHGAVGRKPARVAAVRRAGWTERSGTPEPQAEPVARRGYIRADMGRSLSLALERDEFELWYQPQVASMDGTIRCVEALIRWRHPARGLIALDEFLPLAEEAGMVDRIGAWVVERACQDASAWPEGIAVAVSATTAWLSCGTFLRSVEGIMAGSGFLTERLELEIPARALTEKGGETLDAIAAIRSRGIKLVLGDLENGCSCLTMLYSNQIDKLKVDVSLVRPMSDRPVGSLIGIARALKICTVAKGVETLEQAEELKALGCDLFQGNRYHRPLPQADVLAAMLAR